MKVTIDEDLYSNLRHLEWFIRDCCMTGDINPNNPIAPMSEEETRTVGEVLQEILDAGIR